MPENVLLLTARLARSTLISGQWCGMMNEPNRRDRRIAEIRRQATEFLVRLRRVDPDMLIQLAVEMRSGETSAGFKLEIKEGLPPLPFDKSPFDKVPFNNAPFGDSPWHDRARPPEQFSEPLQRTKPLQRRRTRKKGRPKSKTQRD